MRWRCWKPRASNLRPAPKTFRSRASSHSRAPFRLIPRIDRPGSQFCLQTADKIGQSRLALALEAFASQYLAHLSEGGFNVVVDDDVVVFRPVAQFLSGLRHALLNDMLHILSTEA